MTVDDIKQLPPRNPMAEFQERVLSELKTKIGEMLPDEALQELVKRAVEEQFFTPRKVINPNGMYSRPEFIEKPSWFVEEVAKSAEPVIKKLVEEYVEQNKMEIEKAVKQFLEAQNLLLLTFAALRMQMFPDIAACAEAIIVRMKQQY